MQEKYSTLKVGMKIKGRYIVEDVLGKRNFDAVYLVRDQRTSQKLFILKEVPKPIWKDRVRFIFDSMALTDLDHPALPHVYKVFHYDKIGRTFMLVEYIEGQNLEALRLGQTNHRFSSLQVMTSIVPIVEAVAYLHNQDRPIIHGNIKPSNIIMHKESGVAMLVSFGFMKKLEKDKTVIFENYHSPGYKAPEQYSGVIDRQTDIYALGAVLYTLLTGNFPAGVLYRVRHLLEKDFDPLLSICKIAPHVPTDIASAVHRAMSIDKSERYDTVEQFWNALWLGSTIDSNFHHTVEQGERSRDKRR